MSEPKSEMRAVEAALSKQIKDVLQVVRAVETDVAAVRSQLDLLFGDASQDATPESHDAPLSPAEDDRDFAKAVVDIENRMMAQIEKRIRSLEELIEKFTVDPAAKPDPTAMAQLDDQALATLIADKMKTKLFERKQLARLAMMRKLNRSN